MHDDFIVVCLISAKSMHLLNILWTSNVFMLLVKSEYCSYYMYIIFPNKELQRLKIFKYYCWKVIYEHISTFWHTATLNTGLVALVKRTHVSKRVLSYQSQYTACIVVKVMFFEAQINRWCSTRSWITFPSIISCHVMEPSMIWFISEISYLAPDGYGT